jgi:dipeptidyl aminopeptidase/acylaminoacyl peptidase
MVFSPDRTTMATIENAGGFSSLRLRKIDDGSDLPLPELPKGVISGVDFSENGKYLAFSLVSPILTDDVWRVDLEKQELVRMTRSCLAGLDPKTFVGPELIHYPTFDGKKIPAFLYTPPGAERDGTMPAIILVHGGPEGQERPYFSRFRQIFLRKGYAILAPNVRGSTGYGKAFTHLDDVEKRLDSVKDLAAGYDYLVEQKIADPEKIAVLGGSYGGYMVLAGLTEYPDKYAAGIDIVGIASFTTFLRNTASYRRALREAEYGSLEDDAEFLEAISPLNHVDKIQAPLMVIHGKNDPRVPYTEAEQIVNALKEREQPVEYLLFEDEGHGVAKLDNRVVMYVRIVEFLDRYLMGATE